MAMPRPTDETKEWFREIVGGPGVLIRPMFGQLGAFVEANVQMFACLFGDRMGVRVAPERLEEAEALPGVDGFPPGSDRHFRGWVTLPAGTDDDEVTFWVRGAQETTETLPPKEKKKR
ncbi:MAG: hypothetical protein Q4G67_10125 [Actinomycetia bacterium]|nr:hypothetical protein [Actinomycetes bacterium]